MHRSFKFLVALLGTVLLVLAGGSPAAARPGRPVPVAATTAVGTGINPTNDNAQPTENLSARLAASWGYAAPSCPQTGDMATSVSVSVTTTVVVHSQYQCSFVTAHANATGRLLWSRAFYRAGRAVINGDLVFIAHDDENGRGDQIEAVQLSSGQTAWSAGAGFSIDSNWVSVDHGVATVGTLARDAATGRELWQIAPHDPDIGLVSIPLVVGDRVYLNMANYSLAALEARTGRRIWTVMKGQGFDKPGNFDAPASVHDGRVYAIGYYATLVVDAASGRRLTSLPGSAKPIAFTGDIGIFSVPGANGGNAPSVRAVDVRTGRTVWNHPFPVVWPSDGLFTPVMAAPLITAGLVWVQTGRDSATKAQLTALDLTTGEVRSTLQQPCPPASPDWSSLVAAQRRLFTTNDCGVLTYTNPRLNWTRGR